MQQPTRRSFMQSSIAAAAVLAGSPAVAGESASPSLNARSAYAYRHAPAPLPFDPRSLRGLSERLIQSHWENNYQGSVTALNVVRERLAQLRGDANTPAYVYNDLKREHLMRTGSVVLHELYFGNLGGDGRAGAGMRTRIANAFGTFDAWEAEFRKIAQGLGGGSGWVVLGLNHQLNTLENYWMADHATAPVATTPLLVMDMYEHSYHIDFGAAAARYIDAFFANINWETVAARA